MANAIGLKALKDDLASPCPRGLNCIPFHSTHVQGESDDGTLAATQLALKIRILHLLLQCFWSWIHAPRCFFGDGQPHAQGFRPTCLLL